MENGNRYYEKQWKFKDGQKTIDYVLVWNENSSWATTFEAADKRDVFEANLKEEGLELEYEFVESTGLHFVKIHSPLAVLQSYAEILKLCMPIKDALNKRCRGLNPDHKCCFKIFFPCLNFMEINPKVFPRTEQELTAPYSRARDYLFDAVSPGFFTPAQKARVVRFILERTLYAEPGMSDVFEFGINRLVLYGIYDAAYPLHEDDQETPGSLRYRFFHYWASFKNFYKKQPADYLRQYFGVKTALYFMWLGHYTRMLIPASVVGVACFIASLYLLPYSNSIDEICNGDIKGVICPKCDHYCKFKNVTDSCFQTKLLNIFDNITTVVFAIFISFWAAIFLECWKRYSAEITVRWDLTTLDDRDENPRPEYAAKLSRLAAEHKVSHRLNFITNATEPKVSFWKYMFPGKLLSLTTMLLLISMAVAGLIAVVLYHMIALSVLPVTMLSTMTATCLNLVCILIFSPIYWRLAQCLTDLEMPRTQKEFDGSLTVKMYVLEFINHYASIFYIAFFKGKFVGPPSGYYRIFGFRQLECGAGGCMFELTQQLAIIMIGKRAYRSLIQVFQPIITHKLRKRFSNLAANRGDQEIGQWEKDYLLDEASSPLLLSEYIDMVLQYGFVTIFASAFPLAPLFALINNIFEIRIDAQKYLVYHRRVTMRRTKDIGVWYDILNFISCLAIFTNGFIIAFTSNFVPRLVYSLTVSPDHGMAGYMNYSMSYIEIQDLDMEGRPNTTEEYCRYFDHREPPWSEHPYEETKMFWTVLAARLAFFIIFENMIFTAVIIVKWLIPDIPQNVKWQMRRRRYLINEMIINHEIQQKSRKFENDIKTLTQKEEKRKSDK